MQDQPIVIAVIEGTIRPARKSLQAAQYVAAIGAAYPGVEIVFVDPRDFSFPEDGNENRYRDPRYTAIVERADAFFIVTPEYNHSFPGSLKRMLDSEYTHYIRKPVAVAGVSDGDWGGTRAVEALLPVLRSLHLLVLQQTVYFKRVLELFDDAGSMVADQEPAYRKGIEGSFNELIWTARALKTARTVSA